MLSYILCVINYKYLYLKIDDAARLSPMAFQRKRLFIQTSGKFVIMASNMNLKKTKYPKHSAKRTVLFLCHIRDGICYAHITAKL